MLRNASAAMAGMAHEYATFWSSSQNNTPKDSSSQQPRDATRKEKRIAITMFGLTTPGVNAAMEQLLKHKDEATGEALYNPIVFHATGSGGRSMERLIQEGVSFALTLFLFASDLVSNL